MKSLIVALLLLLPFGAEAAYRPVRLKPTRVEKAIAPDGTLLLRVTRRAELLGYFRVVGHNRHHISPTVYDALLPLSTLLPADVNAVSCSNTDIQDAITNDANDGDRVVVPNDPCTWTGSVSIPATKGLTIDGQGACTSAKCVTWAGGAVITSSFALILNKPTTASTNTIIKGFKFISTSGSSASIGVNGLDFAPRWRIHENEFDGNDLAGSVAIINVNQRTAGLIDNNLFHSWSVGGNARNAVFVEWDDSTNDGSNGQGAYVWTQAAERGTEQAVYVQNNSFDSPGNGAGSSFAGAINARWGAKYVFRYNQGLSTGAGLWIQTHSGCTNTGRQPIWVEIYGNTDIGANSDAAVRSIELRSVSGIIWNNSIDTDHNNAINLDFERAWRTNCGGGPPVWNTKCDGTQSVDENQGGASTPFGYRCHGQPGWGQPQVLDMTTATFQGVFGIDNLKGATPTGVALTNTTATPLPNYMTTYIVGGRDVFNDTAGHIIEDVEASLPGTCDPGPADRDVFWATDTNKLYVCTATNVFTLWWTPLGAHSLETTPSGPAVTLNPDPPSMVFSNTEVGTNNDRVVTLTNSGDSLLTITSIVVTGTDFSKFADNCGATLAASASCQTTVRFSPTAATTRNGSVTYTTDASSSPDVLLITGLGIATPPRVPSGMIRPPEEKR